MGGPKSKNSGHAAVLPADYRQRTYRQRVAGVGRVRFEVVCQETDLMIQADTDLQKTAREHVLALRSQLESFIADHPGFATTLIPWPTGQPAPAIVRQMIAAGHAAGVGPMAAVAGAVAESVGRELLHRSRQVVVENGGDVFLKAEQPVVAALFAGGSPLSMKVGIRVSPATEGLGICTSSATVGHSLSTGCADAICVVSADTALADAAATAIGNRVRHHRDIEAAIAFGRRIQGTLGIVIIVGRHIGAWGGIELLPLGGKKG